MAKSEEEEGRRERLGLWIIGALGDVATTAIVGARAIARGLASTTGLVTELAELAPLPLCPLSGFVFGGHDIRSGGCLEAARALEADIQSFGPALIEALAPELAAIDGNIRPGLAAGCSEALRANLAADLPRGESGDQAVGRLRADLRAFAEAHELDRVVVVHLTSTEPSRPPSAALEQVDALMAALDGPADTLPASVLYALAAIEEGAPFVNFTPCIGSSAPALIDLAEARGVCHAGRDGKTGETLMRTVLAPMFLARNLRVLSWSGFNVLGNRDGRVLADPGANEAKTRGKDAVLRSILGDHLDDSLTRIDYVPSLKDWKTAWDLIHFEGFLGTKMSLQFTWQGADSALAAPLVLDLARLLALAQDAGQRGVIPDLACFFKAPMGGAGNSFPEQVARFEAWASEIQASFIEA